MTLLIIAFVILVAYVATSIGFFGIPPSLSETFYLWGKYKLSWLFSVTMVVVAALTWLGLTQTLPEKYLWAAWLSVTGLIFVAATPCFKQEYQGKIHTTSAMLCAVAAVVLCCLLGQYITLASSVVVFTIACLINKRKNLVFWAEMAAFFSLFVSSIAAHCV